VETEGIGNRKEGEGTYATSAGLESKEPVQ
jgi:hypothetical protein